MACIAIQSWGELWDILEKLEMAKNMRSEENKSVKGEKKEAGKAAMKGSKKMDEKEAKKVVGKKR